MTEPTTNPTTDDTTATPAATATPRKSAPRKAAAKKPPAKKEFAPKVTESGRLDHSDCGHPRDMKGRSACRAEFAKANKK